MQCNNQIILSQLKREPQYCFIVLRIKLIIYECNKVIHILHSLIILVFIELKKKSQKTWRWKSGLWIIIWP